MRRIAYLADRRRLASLAFLSGYKEGRPWEDLRNNLPRELEAAGQRRAAAIVRSFFSLGLMTPRLPT
jgi:hypothetical protein